MKVEFLRRIWLRVGELFFRVLYAPQMLGSGRRAFICWPFRLDGAGSIKLGDYSVVQARSWLYCVAVDGIPAQLTIGSRCVLGYGNHIATVREVVIGDDVLTANNVYISDNLHSYEDISTPIMRQPVRFKHSVHIGQGTWIGENVCVIGASIGRNCIIGANSVVTNDIPDFSVAVGAPARVIRQYDHVLHEWVNK
jgi:acetyltransferase-like isoleucine patch superfamily enzyme